MTRFFAVLAVAFFASCFVFAAATWLEKRHDRLAIRACEVGDWRAVTMAHLTSDGLVRPETFGRMLETFGVDGKNERCLERAVR